MSATYWMNEGLGVSFDEFFDCIDTEKVQNYLLRTDVFEYLEAGEYKEWLITFNQADNSERHKMLHELIYEEHRNLATLITASDPKKLLCEGNDGDGSHYILYPPSYPWSRNENDCATEAEAKEHICSVLSPFTFDHLGIDRIIDYVDYIYEVGIG